MFSEVEVVSVDVVVGVVVDVAEAVVVVTGSLGANTRGICWIRVLGLLLLGASEAGSSVCSSCPKLGRVGLKLEVDTYSLLVVVSVDRGVSSKAAVGVVEMVVEGVAVVVEGGEVLVVSSCGNTSGLMVGNRNSTEGVSFGSF